MQQDKAQEVLSQSLGGQAYRCLAFMQRLAGWHPQRQQVKLKRVDLRPLMVAPGVSIDGM